MVDTAGVLTGASEPVRGLPPGLRLPAAVQMTAYLASPYRMMSLLQRRFGDAFSLRFPVAGTLCFFTHPEHVKAIFSAPAEELHAGESNGFILAPLVGARSLLLLDEAEHLRERRLLLPPFHGERMRAYLEVMRQVTSESLARWPLDRPFALHPWLQAITLDIILRAVFGVSEGPRCERLRTVIPRVLDGIASPALLAFRFVGVDPFRRLSWLPATHLKHEMDRLIFEEIAARRGGARGEDVLSLLFEARDEDGRALGDAELRDELVTLLVAGHETTATALAWAFERLAAQPDVAERCRSELASVLGERPLAPEDLPRLSYLDAVVKEILRLRPIVPLVGRLVKRPIAIGPWRLPAGVRLAALIMRVQQRAELYPEPERFRPERFLERSYGPHEWLPFGGGVRRCLGMAFALFEMKVVLATVLARARFEPGSDRAAAVARRHITIVPDDGARIVLRAR